MAEQEVKTEETPQEAEARRGNFLKKHEASIQKIKKEKPENMVDYDIASEKGEPGEDHPNFTQQESEFAIEKSKDGSVRKFNIQGMNATENDLIEWKNNGLRQADYTRKTQELANERKAVTEVHTEASNIVSFFNQIMKNETIKNILEETISDNIENGKDLLEQVLKFDSKKFRHPAEIERDEALEKLAEKEGEKKVDEVIETFANAKGISKEDAMKVLDKTIMISANQAKELGLTGKQAEQFVIPMDVAYYQMLSNGELTVKGVEEITDTEEEFGIPEFDTTKQGADDIKTDSSAKTDKQKQQKRKQTAAILTKSLQAGEL